MGSPEPKTDQLGQHLKGLRFWKGLGFWNAWINTRLEFFVVLEVISILGGVD